jgi:hypothetical protein
MGSAAARLAARARAVAAAVVLAGALGGCQGTGGAVSVRWRVRDLRTGMSWDPSTISARFGDVPKACCWINRDGACTPDNAWIVDQVQIHLGDPVTGEPLLTDLTDNLKYPCATREATTGWTVPVGRYAVSLSAVAHDYEQHPVQAATPAAEVRDLTAGGVVNLQVIEVAVDPLPLPLPTMGSMATQ